MNEFQRGLPLGGAGKTFGVNVCRHDLGVLIENVHHVFRKLPMEGRNMDAVDTLQMPHRGIVPCAQHTKE
jgi:hypothetical protein